MIMITSKYGSNAKQLFCRRLLKVAKHLGDAKQLQRCG